MDKLNHVSKRGLWCVEVNVQDWPFSVSAPFRQYLEHSIMKPYVLHQETYNFLIDERMIFIYISKTELAESKKKL